MNRRRRFSLLLAGLVICVLAPVIQGRKAPNIFADTPAGTSVADAGPARLVEGTPASVSSSTGARSVSRGQRSAGRGPIPTRCARIKGDIPVEVYDNLYKSFNPTLFDADRWAAMAKEAGTRYVVLTAKHCDGFCLWRSAESDHHIGLSPFQRDICGELAEAVRKAGLRIGWYYSPMDWYDPDCRTERNAAYVKRMQGQIRELVTRYGRIDVLWFDWDGGTIPWDQAATYRIVRQAQPSIIINNRLTAASAGFRPTATWARTPIT